MLHIQKKDGKYFIELDLNDIDLSNLKDIEEELKNILEEASVCAVENSAKKYFKIEKKKNR